MLGMAAPAWAQGGGVLKGSVHDVSGAPLPGAVVTVSDPQQMRVRVAITDLRGEYVVEGLERTTEYRVEVSHPKFRKRELQAQPHDGAAEPITLEPRRRCSAGRQ